MLHRAEGIMRISRALIGVGISLFLFGIGGLAGGQDAAPPPPAETPQQSASEPADLSQAYYHYTLARRYKELAAIHNRSEFVQRAVAEYKKAMEADPGSLFLRVEVAELYWHLGRIADAVREAEAVLKVNPDQDDAHRLLAQIYWRNLGEAQRDTTARESLQKAIEHFEALARLNPTETETYLVLGRLYRLNNQPEKAEEAFKKILDNEPDSKNAAAHLAQLYFDQGDYEHAIELLKRIDEEEMDAPLLGMLAYAYTQTSEFDKAVEVYEKALAQDAENQEVRRAYAEALMGGGRLAAARTELEKILKADPEDGSARLRLAQLDRQEGRFEDARKNLERAQALMADSLEVPYQQVLLEDSLGNHEEAIKILQGLLKKGERTSGQYTTAEATNRAIFLERLGQVYRSQQKYDQALEVFNEIVKLGDQQGPRGEALIIETLRLSRQAQKAAEATDAAVEKYPKDRSLRILRATLWGERGKVDEAVQQLQELLNKTPSDREIYLAIAQIHLQAKRFPEAEAAARQALTLSPDQDDQEYVFFVLGSIYERQKKYDLAEEEFRKVLAANPLNAAASNYLGYMLADRGVRLEESVKYIQKALELDPSNGAYMDSLGWAYFKMNRYDLAEPHLEKAAQLISGDPTIQEHLGHLYIQMGKKSLAREAWERALKEWPDAVSSDFDAEQAAKLQKELDDLKGQLDREKSAQR
jgi:tetratricopeptide (TPR) repeat protein